MQDHAQMIPCGVNCEIIPLGTHDKMRWFLKDINVVECYIDLRKDVNYLCEHLVNKFPDVHKKI